MEDTRVFAWENRIPPPVLMILMGAGMWFVPRGPVIVAAAWGGFFAIPLALAGFAILALGFLEFRRQGTTIDPVQIGRATTLVKSGIFRFTRNPMYVGMVTLLLAWAIFLGGITSLLGPVLFSLFLDNFQIRPEERAMSRKFGRDYEDYCKEVRRWL